MAIDTKDLETLRAESQQLGSRITRLSIILVSVLTVVTFTITDALNKIDLPDLKAKLEAAQRSRESAYNAYEQKRRELDKRPTNAEPEQSLKEEVDSLRGLWEKAGDEEQEAQRKYDAVTKESFSLSPSVLGSGLKIDLRAWIYSIPFIVLVAFIYIQILRKKQKILSVVAASLLSNNTETTKIDHLTFSERPGVETPYARNPSQLEQTIYLLIILFLISLTIVAMDSAQIALLGLGVKETFQYLLMFLSVSFYAVSYYYYVSISLDEQTSAITGWPAKPSSPVKTWRKLQGLTRRLASRLKPQIPLATGSLLILASLFLSTSASCANGDQVVQLPGYKLLQESGGKLWYVEKLVDNLEMSVEELGRGEGLSDNPAGILSRDPGGGWWITTIMNTKIGWISDGLYWRHSINNIGRHAYGLSLVLAALTLLVVLCSVGRQKISGIKKAYAALFLLSMTLSLIIITDFAFNAFWFKDELFLLSNLFWIVPAAFLCRITLSNSEKTRAQRAGLKHFSVTLLLPLVVSATVYVCYVALDGFIGVLVYFVGINLLSVTYLKIVSAYLRDNEVTLEGSPKELVRGA